MFPVQLPVMKPDEFSRCDERMQQRDPGKVPGPMQRTDISIKGSVERAIWNDEVLRAIEYYHIDIHVKNGVVHLSGHIANTASRKRIENALRSLPDILGVRNQLILDEQLTHEIAGSLGPLEHTYDCKFFTGVSHGWVSLNGIVRDANVKLLAEKCASTNAHVRGVINHVQVAGGEPLVQDLPLLQPDVGETIYFLDGVSGVVTQVIVNPNNRRVIAMLVQVRFADQQKERASLKNNETWSPERRVVIPMDLIRYLTPTSGFLHIKSDDRNRYMDFDPASFFTPGPEWTPPFPYCTADVLFPAESRVVETQAVEQSIQHPLEELLEGESSREQIFAGDDLER